MGKINKFENMNENKDKVDNSYEDHQFGNNTEDLGDV